MASRFLRVASLCQQSVTGLSTIARASPSNVSPFASSRLAFFRGLHTSSRFLNEEITVVLPPVAESISEGEIGGWEKEVGDFVALDEAVVMVDTDKTTVPVNAPVSGTITELLVEEGDVVLVGADLFKMLPGEGDASTTPAAPKVEQTLAPASTSAPTPTPAPTPVPASKPKPTSTPTPVSHSTPTTTGGVTRVKMTRIRKRTSERLKESQNTAAMLTTFNEIDMSNIMKFRSKHKDAFLKKHGVKLGFMSAFCKASAWALEQTPAVNAFIDTDNEHIVYHDDVNISIAVATPKGLVVPVVRRVQDLTFAGVEKEIARLGNLARDGALAIEDMDGGTFTISNGGVFGSLMGTPIINPPQSAILGMHGIFDRPVAVNGEVVIRPMMYIALTYDHRLIDGREAVTFLRNVKQAVEDPAIIVLE
eukprot:m.134594 g.134594  ORF g.134594 m.134594 type:complete len:421 (+) comp9649_c0_seq1:21-1283(+)